MIKFHDDLGWNNAFDRIYRYIYFHQVRVFSSRVSFCTFRADQRENKGNASPYEILDA